MSEREFSRLFQTFPERDLDSGFTQDYGELTSRIAIPDEMKAQKITPGIIFRSD
jgi:hypothetical protein